MNPLLPCPSCARHVKSSEAACPFCSSSLSGKLTRRAPTTTKRLERLAAFTFAAAVLVTGCAVAGDEESDKQESELGGFHAMYGMPPPPVDAGPPPPPVDAGPPPPPPCHDDNADTDDSHGGFAALYGMPPHFPPPCTPVVDAGPPPVHHDGGGYHTMYGMPPAPHD